MPVMDLLLLPRRCNFQESALVMEKEVFMALLELIVLMELKELMVLMVDFLVYFGVLLHANFLIFPR